MIVHFAFIRILFPRKISFTVIEIIIDPNRFSGLNSATTFQTGLLRSRKILCYIEIESSIFDKLLKMVSSNIKPIIPDSQTVKSNTNNLLRAIGVNEV